MWRGTPAGHICRCVSKLHAHFAAEPETIVVLQGNKDSMVGKARQFGDYQLLDEIARGGMGIVYRARQVSLNRVVAVKMILAGQFAGKEIAQRFKSEAGAAAVLQHPNIVAVHEVGVHEGQHFFSMDYVEGQTLAQLVGNMDRALQRRHIELAADPPGIRDGVGGAGRCEFVDEPHGSLSVRQRVHRGRLLRLLA